MSLDLKNLPDEKQADNKGTVIEVKDRNGDPYLDDDGKPATMTVLGYYAEPVQRAVAANDAAFRKRARRGGDPFEGAEDAQLNVLSAAVSAWTGWKDGNAPAPCTSANVRLVLKKMPWIRPQVQGPMDAPKLFTGSGSAS